MLTPNKNISLILWKIELNIAALAYLFECGSNATEMEFDANGFSGIANILRDQMARLASIRERNDLFLLENDKEI